MLLLHPGRRVIPPSGVAASRATQTSSPTSAAWSTLTTSGVLCRHSRNTRGLLDKCLLSFSNHTHLPLSRTRKEVPEYGQMWNGRGRLQPLLLFPSLGSCGTSSEGARWTGCGVIWVCAREVRQLWTSPSTFRPASSRWLELLRLLWCIFARFSGRY